MHLHKVNIGGLETPNNVFLDGDDCWNMRPFTVNDATKRMVLGNIAALLNNFLSIDNTNAAGAVAALASLKDEVFFQKSLESTNLSRKIVTDALDELGLKYLPSQANFIFHQIKGDHQTYKDRMAAAHVFVGREFPPAVGYNRLTLGTPAEMRAFVKVLKTFRQKGWI